MRKFTVFKRRKVTILGVGIFLFFLGAFFVLANYVENSNTSNTVNTEEFYEFPDKYSQDGSVHNAITASGPDNSLDYYVGGYGVFINFDENLERTLKEFYIKKPALHNNELFNPNRQACGVDGGPNGCYGVKYVFKWYDPVLGLDLISEVQGHKFQSTGYVDVMPELLKNVKIEALRTDIDVPYIRIDNGIEDTLLVRVHFLDDKRNEGISSYRNVSKKFVFRTRSKESSYIGVASTDTDLWDPNTGEIAPENFWDVNFATVHVAANSHGNLVYKAILNKGDDIVRFINVDMDNKLLDDSSSPPMYSYIDTFIKQKNENGVYQWISSDGTFSEEIPSDPIYRISPTKNGGSYSLGRYNIPSVNESRTKYIQGPSGSFLCNGLNNNESNVVTVGHQDFSDCYNGTGRYASNGGQFYGIMQHTLSFEHLPESDSERIVVFRVHNASSAYGNAFAFAGDIDIFGGDVPIEETLLEGNVGKIVTGTTTVEVDIKGSKDDESDFNDDGKPTKINALHTYKTSICNYTDSSVNNVTVKLNKPNHSKLIDIEDTKTSSSSLMVDGTNLDEPVDISKKVSLTAFDSKINLGHIEKGDCKYISYQIIVENTAQLGDVLRVTNQFSYNQGEMQDTNQVENPIATEATDVTLVLESTPEDGENISKGDVINYQLTVNNSGVNDIENLVVTCPGFLDNSKRKCSSGDCEEVYTIDRLNINEEHAILYSSEILSGVNLGDKITEQCDIEYDDTSKKSNIINHNIVDSDIPTNPNDFTDGKIFSLEISMKPKMVNTKDVNVERGDKFDSSNIKYLYDFDGTGENYMSPSNTRPGGYTDSRGSCSPESWPYRPGAKSYNINSTKTTSSNMNFGNYSTTFYLNTTLPDGTGARPETILSQGTLTPTDTIVGSDLNNRYSQGGQIRLPDNSTRHRGIKNGTDGIVSSNISGKMYLDTWEYVKYDTGRCSYSCGSDENPRTCRRSYNLYRWERQSREDVNFYDLDTHSVTVTSSAAYFRSRGGLLHSNVNITENGTDSNRVDLGVDGYRNVLTSPKDYAPDGRLHNDIMVSSNTENINLKSRWYAVKDLSVGKGEMYDREINPRNFYDDILNKKKFGPVLEEGEDNLSNPLNTLSLETKKVYHYPGDLTIGTNVNNPVYIGGESHVNVPTIVIEGDLYIKSDMLYNHPRTVLGVFVKGNMYIDGDVTNISGIYTVDGTVYTGDSAKRLKMLGSIFNNKWQLSRNPVEYFDGEVNPPSEDIIYDNNFILYQPPGYTELPDTFWSQYTNVNLWSKKIIE